MVALGADMKRRFLIYACSALISLVLVLFTMQVVCYFLNRIFGYPPIPKHNVIWLIK
jgi:hypothetical protein